MCILIPKFSLSAGRLIRAQADERHRHSLERPEDSMEITCFHCCSKDTVSSPHCLQINKEKEIEACGRLSNYTNETENYRDHLNDQLGLNHKLKWTTRILFLFSCYPDHYMSGVQVIRNATTHTHTDLL